MKNNYSRLAAIIFAVSILIGVVGCAKPKVQLQVSRDRIQEGEDVRVTWTSKDAKQLTLNGQTVDKNGAQVFTPNNTTTYTAVATRGKKEARDSKVVAGWVRPAPPPHCFSSRQKNTTPGQNNTPRPGPGKTERVAQNQRG